MLKFVSMKTWAIIKTGGKQYKVAEGDTIAVEKLQVNSQSIFSFDEVLLVSNDGKLQIGRPYIEKAKVKAKILEDFKDKKIRVVKFKSKSRYLKVRGHRQKKTKVLIDEITS